MNLAILEQKNLINPWRKNQARPDKNQKRRRSIGKKLKQKKNSSSLGEFLITLATVIAKIILIVACSYGLFAGYRFATNSLHFNINKINWSGHQHLTTNSLNQWIGPIVGENIFKLNINSISQRLADHPWVKTASVKRIFPQGIHVELKERTPFARIKLDQVYIMDNYGVLLETEGKVLNTLPLITGFSAKNPSLGSNVASENLIDGLTAMHNINLLPIFQNNPIETVNIINRSRVTYTTRSRNMEIHMRPEVVHENIKNLALILETIKEDENNFSYIDLSFKNKIVIKHKNKLNKFKNK